MSGLIRYESSFLFHPGRARFRRGLARRKRPVGPVSCGPAVICVRACVCLCACMYACTTAATGGGRGGRCTGCELYRWSAGRVGVQEECGADGHTGGVRGGRAYRWSAGRRAYRWSAGVYRRNGVPSNYRSTPANPYYRVLILHVITSYKTSYL